MQKPPRIFGAAVDAMFLLSGDKQVPATLIGSKGDATLGHAEGDVFQVLLTGGGESHADQRESGQRGEILRQGDGGLAIQLDGIAGVAACHGEGVERTGDGFRRRDRTSSCSR